MHEAVTVLAWLLSALAVGAGALALWNALAWPGVGRAGGPLPPLSVLIPARNEEQHLPRLLASLDRQAEQPLEILVYDDHSTDGTAEVVRRFAQTRPQTRLVPARSLPEGWSGKCFACMQLAAQARGEWLLFLDADTALAPEALGRICRTAQARQVTLLGCWPGLDMHGFWERVGMPMLNFVVFTLFPAPLSLRMNLPSLGLAHGACLLMRRAEYERVGGHAAVQAELFEDTALARAWRAAGLRGICLDGQEVVRVRMYDSFGALWRGFQKIIYPAFRRSASFWLFLVFHATVFLLPFVLWAAGCCRLPILVAVAAILTLRWVQAVRFRYPWWSALLHPVAELGLLALGLSAWWQCRVGNGVSWKGRAYFQGGRPAGPR